MRMCLFCLRYLTTSAFKPDQDEKEIQKAALSGYYGLLDYTVAHWDHHGLFVLTEQSKNRQLESSDLAEELRKTWHIFSARYINKSDTADSTSPSGEQMGLEVTADTLDSGLQLRTAREADTIQETAFIGWKATTQSTEFEKATILVRQAMNQIILDNLNIREKDAYSLNGAASYKCPRRACTEFSRGFTKEEELEQHISQHEMAFKCPHESCYAWMSGFSSNHHLQSHLNRVHAEESTNNDEELFPRKSRKKLNSEDIFQACKLGDIEAVKAFVEQGVDVNQIERGRDAWTPIITAAHHGHIALCQYLARHMADPFGYYFTEIGYGTSAISEAIKQGDFDLFQALVAARPKEGEKALAEGPLSDKYLRLALSASDDRFYTYILFNGNSVNPGTAVSKLLKLYFDRKEHQINPANIRVVLMDTLKRYKNRVSGPWTDQTTNTEHGIWNHLLIVACSEGWLDVVKYLLQKLAVDDIYPNASNGNRRPPLFEAIYSDQFDIIQLLFENDFEAARNCRNWDGDGPVHYAFRHLSLERLSRFVEIAKDAVNDTNDEGDTALHKVVLLPSQNFVTKIEILCKSEFIDFLRRDKHGKTAFACAAGTPYIDSISVLKVLYKQYPEWATTKDDAIEALCPLHHAINKCNTKTIEYFLSIPEASVLVDMCRPQFNAYNRETLVTLLNCALHVKSELATDLSRLLLL